MVARTRIAGGEPRSSGRGYLGWALPNSLADTGTSHGRVTALAGLTSVDFDAVRFSWPTLAKYWLGAARQRCAEPISTVRQEAWGQGAECLCH